MLGSLILTLKFKSLHQKLILSTQKFTISVNKTMKLKSR